MEWKNYSFSLNCTKRITNDFEDFMKVVNEGNAEWDRGKWIGGGSRGVK